MKPVFRRPSSIIKQFSGLTVNQDKTTKRQPARLIRQYNAPSLKPTHSEKKHETHPPHPNPRHTHRLRLRPYRWLRLCRQQRRFRRRDPNIPLVRPPENNTVFYNREQTNPKRKGKFYTCLFNLIYRLNSA